MTSVRLLSERLTGCCEKRPERQENLLCRAITGAFVLGEAGLIDRADARALSPLEELARNAGLSPRTLTRWCQQELGESPAALVRRLRVEEAQRLLEQTSLPLKEIAARAHPGDTSTLWRVFIRYFGVTPADYRARFAGRPIGS